MAVSIRCPNLRCRKVLKVPGTSRGQRVRCTFCKKVLMVPFANPCSSGSTPATSPFADKEDAPAKRPKDD